MEAILTTLLDVAIHHPAIILLIILALAFDFSNGMHDSANSIATIVATRVMSPKRAIVMAAGANFLAFFLFTNHEVAKTVGSGLIELSAITLTVTASALVAAISWNLLTWKLGLPSSSSHSLFGGLLGAGVAHAGWSVVVVIWWIKVLGFMIFAPLLWAVLGGLILIILLRVFRRVDFLNAQQYAKYLQIGSSLLYSIGHGGNDAQKTMGIIAGILVAGGVYSQFEIPFWVALLCYTAIGMGTLFGGMRIIRTMGSKITKLTPIWWSAATLAGSISLFSASALGIPVSTTHVITGAISGVGAIRNPRRVHWDFAMSIVSGWFLTIPGAAIVGAGTFFLFSYFWSFM